MIPRFYLGDTVLVKINDEMIQCKIIIFPNGAIVLHTNDLRHASEMNYSHLYKPRRTNLRDKYTRYNQCYAISLNNNSFTYLVLLPTGENIEVSEEDLLINRNDDVRGRNIRNARSRIGVNTLKKAQVDKRESRVPYLPDTINDHIKSYLTETPFSSHMKTRIDNRNKPRIPSSAVFSPVVDNNNNNNLEMRMERINRMFRKSAYKSKMARRKTRKEKNNKIVHSWKYSMDPEEYGMELENDTEDENESADENEFANDVSSDESDSDDEVELDDESNSGNISGGMGETSKMTKVRKVKKVRKTRKIVKKRKIIKRKKG